MKVVATERQRRLLVRVSGAEDVLEALEDLAHKEELRAAWIRGVGTLERAELEHGRVDEPCEVVSLEGSIAWHDVDPTLRLRVVLVPLTDGTRVLGGVLAAAPAIDVQLVVECYDDVPVQLARAAPRIEARPSTSLIEPAEEPVDEDPERGAFDDDEYEDEEYEEDAPAPSGPVSWADVAAASAQVEEPEPPPRRPQRAPEKRRSYEPPPMPGTAREVLEVLPDKGDFVQHRQFGLCKIEKTDGRGSIVIKLASGVRKTLRLDFMDVGRARMEGGRKVYPVRPRKK